MEVPISYIYFGAMWLQDLCCVKSQEMNFYAVLLDDCILLAGSFWKSVSSLMIPKSTGSKLIFTKTKHPMAVSKAFEMLSSDIWAASLSSAFLNIKCTMTLAVASE